MCIGLQPTTDLRGFS